VTVDGVAVDLTFTEFQVLHFLAKRPGWVFTRSQIVDAARGDNYPVTDRSVDVQIVGLRKKLGQAGKFVETVRGVGYRFKERD
jgi:two-component system phosphate regulon response regulator PhoB